MQVDVAVLRWTTSGKRVVDARDMRVAVSAQNVLVVHSHPLLARMVCWRCGHWVEDPRWLRITGASTARLANLSTVRLRAYYGDNSRDTWVTECSPNCETQQMIRELHELGQRQGLPISLERPLYELGVLAKMIAVLHEQELQQQQQLPHGHQQRCADAEQPPLPLQGPLATPPPGPPALAQAPPEAVSRMQRPLDSSYAWHPRPAKAAPKTLARYYSHLPLASAEEAMQPDEVARAAQEEEARQGEEARAGQEEPFFGPPAEGSFFGTPAPDASGSSASGPQQWLADARTGQEESTLVPPTESSFPWTPAPFASGSSPSRPEQWSSV